MFKDTKRARRRHDWARMVARAARSRIGEAFPRLFADNLAKCSCWMCGNPRRYFAELTMQERRQAVRDHDWDEQ